MTASVIASAAKQSIDPRKESIAMTNCINQQTFN